MHTIHLYYFKFPFTSLNLYSTHIEAHRAGSDIAVFPSDDGTVVYVIRRYQRIVQEILKLIHLDGVLGKRSKPVVPTILVIRQQLYSYTCNKYM